MLEPRRRSRRCSPRAAMSAEPIRMEPESGARMPEIRLRKVVLPEPLSPRRAACSPLAREKPGTSMISLRPPSGAGKDFLSPLSWSSADPGLTSGRGRAWECFTGVRAPAGDRRYDYRGSAVGQLQPAVAVPPVPIPGPPGGSPGRPEQVFNERRLAHLDLSLRDLRPQEPLAVLAKIPRGVLGHHGQCPVELVVPFAHAEARLPYEPVLLVLPQELEVVGHQDNEVPVLLDLGHEVVAVEPER